MPAAKIHEVRFRFLDDRTQVFIRVDRDEPSDLPDSSFGWKYAYFAKDHSMIDILNAWLAGEFNPLLWPVMAPPGEGS